MTDNIEKLKGSYCKTRNHWISSISIKGIMIYLGSFETQIEANQKYIEVVDFFNKNGEDLALKKYKPITFPFDKRLQKYIVYTKIENKLIRIGAFTTKQQAHEAYLNKLKELEK